MKILLVALLATSALAETPPVPKMFKGVQGQKGQYQVEILDGASKSAPQKMTVCTDNLMKSPAQGASNCTFRLLKDTADEAVFESTCSGRTSTIGFKRENANSVLMNMQSDGPTGPQTVKMRYTHLGACREGQGMVTLDKDSEQCRKIREQLAQMDPARQCARQKANREQCEQRIGETRKQLAAMCG